MCGYTVRYIPQKACKVDFLPNHVLEKNRFRMRLELQSCYVKVHVTGTSALDIANANAKTLKTAVD